MNPWWKRPDWYVLDSDYDKRVRKSPFEHRWFRILDKAVKQIMRGLGSFDILIIAGPRRTGKTSILKKIVEYNYRNKGKHFVYIQLDEYPIKKTVVDIGLKTLLNKILTQFGSQEPLIILLDEASAIENWDLHVKNIFDSFTREGKKFLILVTGSLGMRLMAGSTNLLGRRGDIPVLRGIANPGVILPYKFSEFSEMLSRVKTFIRVVDLLRRQEREKALIKLSEKGVVNDISLRKIEILYRRFNEILSKIFSIYLFCGGYPLIVYEFFIKNELRNLDSKWFNEFANMILEDIKYTNLRMDIARLVLDYLQQINKMSPLVDLNKLEAHIRTISNLSRRDLARFSIENYINYFTGSYTMIKAVEFSQRTQHVRRIKVFIIDPFIFHAINSRGVSDPFVFSQEFLKDPTKRGVIMEHVVCSHFLRLPQPTLYYHLHEEEGRTISEIDCICRHLDHYIPVEVTCTEKEERLREEAERVENCLDNIKINTRPIIVSNKMLEIEKNYVIIPAYLFLLLF